MSKADLKAIGARGSVGLKGSGALKGEVTISRGRPYLITANKGLKSEVRFRLDLPLAKAEALAGKISMIGGELHKTGDYEGKISGAKVVIPLKAHRLGDHLEVIGKAANRPVPEPEGLPAGTWIKLERPISVGGQVVKELRLWNDQLDDGLKVKLYGRLDKKNYGGVLRPKGEYFELSGASNLTLGEPRFDGAKFKDAEGQPLVILRHDSPHVVPGPAQLFVLRPEAKLAHLGSFGGQIPQWVNSFHGFRATAAIGAPTEAEKGSFKLLRGKASMDGKELVAIGPREQADGAVVAEGAAHWFDVTTQTVYGTEQAGNRRVLAKVIRVPGE
ncbi:MAG: hypothetical protein IPG45_26375 [Deltaproteobacteria bacterium]|nr:hypothetical protein [Deltaproteobacteria bacterium]